MSCIIGNDWCTQYNACLQAKKSDALRMFIMHHYGGLYLDLDVECYKPADDSLAGYQVVFQGAGDEGINNAIMASVPGKQPSFNYALSDA